MLFRQLYTRTNNIYVRYVYVCFWGWKKCCKSMLIGWVTVAVRREPLVVIYWMLWWVGTMCRLPMRDDTMLPDIHAIRSKYIIKYTFYYLVVDIIRCLVQSWGIWQRERRQKRHRLLSFYSIFKSHWITSWYECAIAYFHNPHQGISIFYFRSTVEMKWLNWME